MGAYRIYKIVLKRVLLCIDRWSHMVGFGHCNSGLDKLVFKWLVFWTGVKEVWMCDSSWRDTLCGRWFSPFDVKIQDLTNSKIQYLTNSPSHSHSKESELGADGRTPARPGNLTNLLANCVLHRWTTRHSRARKGGAACQVPDTVVWPSCLSSRCSDTAVWYWRHARCVVLYTGRW